MNVADVHKSLEKATIGRLFNHFYDTQICCTKRNRNYNLVFSLQKGYLGERPNYSLYSLTGGSCCLLNANLATLKNPSSL